MKRRELISLALAAGLPTAWSQDRSAVLRIVVPYAAGGQSDAVARALAQSMARTLDRSVVVDNRPGAAALIGTRAVQNAAPDANTLLFHNSGFIALPLLTKAPTYDAARDFMPVALVGYGPNFLMINSSVPARSLQEFIAWAKGQPDGVEAANAGLGSAGHLATQLFAKRTGIKIVHIAYKGVAETQNALISGEVKMQLTSPTAVITQQEKAGKVRILAVNSKTRSSLAPELPPISDAVPGFANDVWFGLLAPAGCPPDQVRRIADACRKALGEGEVRERFLQNYMDPQYQDPAGFASVIADSTDTWRSMISELGIQPS